ncbi:G-protein coupled receptor GRL101-like [Amphiura filiformis]|uniref:G-protein coupled receptor GRL101-like n=1 Tax=Amphiura filiformis TaxID=82378 RepID=UPI003B218507
MLLNATFDGLSSLQFLDIRGTLIKRPTPEIFQALHQLDALYSDKYVFCCMVRDLASVTECLPEPDQFSSCEDLMRSQVLRIFMWILGISALLGNGFVIFWRIIPHGQDKAKKSEANIVQSTLVLNLAMADGLMGVYMLIIASADMIYRGVYIVYAEDWQESIICKVAGFLSVLSSETSVFFMTIISIDRFLSITMPFSQINLTPKTAKWSSLIIWGLAFILSIMPVLVQGYFGNEYYGRSSVCLALPLTNDRPAGWEYSVALFLCVNLLAFSIILICYSAIYIVVKLSARNITTTRKNNLTQQIEFAMRMAFLVATDFICWMPIIIMGFLSLTKVATIPPIVYVWSAVFLLPINSSLNPYLFTILTREMSKQKLRKSKRETTKSSGLTSMKSISDTNHSELKLSTMLPTNIDKATTQVIPIMENPQILSKVLYDHDDEEVSLTLKDLEVIEREMEKAFDYFAQNGLGMKPVTEDDILIDKPSGGAVTQAFLMMSVRKPGNDSKTTLSNDVSLQLDQLRDLFVELKGRINTQKY